VCDFLQSELIDGSGIAEHSDLFPQTKRAMIQDPQLELECHIQWTSPIASFLPPDNARNGHLTG
jgi:hypothetical protein